MPRHVQVLNGDAWCLGQAPAGARPEAAAWSELSRVAEWLPATVPGNVRADLLRAGRLPDLAFGTNVEAAQWVDDHCWWLARDFAWALTPGERAHLVLRGVDYISDLFLNGEHLGRHEGMFSPQVHDVTALLRDENQLAVRILGSRWLPSDRSSPWEKLLSQVESRIGGLSGPFPYRRETLKCQMGFGWDFAPPLRTMGLWDDVYLVRSGDVFIRDVASGQRQITEGLALTVTVQLDARQAGSVRLRATLAGETFQAEPLVVERRLDLPPGTSRHTLEIPVPDPRLWWPWDQGRPDLYCLSVEVWAGDRLLDAQAQTIGLRTVALDGLVLRINGRRVQARGANWVPSDILPGRITAGDYRALLALAREANMNMLRVWGGGLREKPAFYDLCDRLGILLWQEFPVACAFLTRYPRSPEFLRLAEAEARAIVRDLRNHPSVALWCGGNEFSPRRNAPLVAALARAAAEEDPARPFLPASPVEGDSHNWRVWHHFQPPSAYLADTAAFASEFGLQAPPGVETLRRFIPPDELWPPGPSWTYHGAGLLKLERYAQPFLPVGRIGNPPCEDFVQASQRAQAHGLQIAIEHYRRRKAGGCGGVLLWQLNEPWPAISWAILDHYRQPKPAYETVKRLLAPVLVSVAYPRQRYQPGDRLRGEVWIVNDLPEALPGCRLEVALGTGERLARTLDVAADSAGVVARLDWLLPPGDDWRLTCGLSRDGQALATNEYDLGVHDDIQPTWRQRLWAWFTKLIVPS
jgi:beta-mannosidase